MSDISRFPEGVLEDTIAADPGTGAAIPVTTSRSIGLALAAAGETNTLAIPTIRGQKLKLSVQSFVALATRAITCAQAINQAGNTVITFDAADQYVILEAWAIDTAGTTLRWRVIFNGGATLS